MIQKKETSKGGEQAVEFLFFKSPVIANIVD